MAAKPKEAFERLEDGTPPIQNRYAENTQRDSDVNVSDLERWASSLAGGALTVFGLKQGGWGGLTLALFGGGLVYRGVTGHCHMYEALKVNTAAGKGRRASVKHGEGVKVDASV